MLSSALNEALKHFPAVLVTGPRQAGKTTFLLLHEYGKKYDYISFDDPLERGFALSDRNGCLERFGESPVLLDEVQCVRGNFPYRKIRIDRERIRNGRWLLTGSQQFQLMRNVNESLAGRIASLELLSFSLLEYDQKCTDFSLPF